MPADTAAAEPARLPDLLIMGDSHTAALELAARAMGLRTVLLYLSGNIWHARAVRIDATGAVSARIASAAQTIAAAQDAMGGNLFRPEVPVLASVGYHLGRLCHGIERKGHRADARRFDAEPGALHISGAVLDAVVTEQRLALWRLLRHAAGQAPLTVVAPPVISENPLFDMVAALCTARLRRMGLTVFDPRETDDLSQLLPEPLRSADGVHGNAAYGTKVLRHLGIEPLIHATV